MNHAHVQGFLDELSKIAFDEAAAAKVLRVAKSKQLPKSFGTAITRQVPGGAAVKPKTPFPSIASFPNRFGAKELPQKAGLMGMMLEGAPAEAKTTAQAIQQRLLSAQPRAPGRIIPGPALKPMRQMATLTQQPQAPRLTGAQNKMFQAVIKGHELDEGRVPWGFGTILSGHRSPEVILREHNKLVTLPQEHAPVRQLIRNARLPEREMMSEFLPKQFSYGESPRVSRHARKHLTRMWSKGMADTAPNDVRQALGL